MTRPNSKYLHPNKIENLLGTLSMLYARENRSDLQRVLVNALIEVAEGVTYDRWDGGQHGHAVTLVLPSALYVDIAREKDTLEEAIRRDLNESNVVAGEHITSVFLTSIPDAGEDWRQRSGLLLPTLRNVPADAQNRIWQEGRFRVFLSHKAEVKKEVAMLKETLDAFGATCFVAHEDIQPTKEWQEEIENAFVALLTTDFHDSCWTDQEVGYAVAVGAPMIAVRLGQDPYGFIGKFQALPCDWNEAPIEIAKLLMKAPSMVDGYISAVAEYKSDAEYPSFDRGNSLAQLLPEIHSPS